MGKDQFTPRQFMVMVILYAIGTAILVVPSTVASEAKQDAWMPELLGIGMGAALVMLYMLVAKQNPSSSLFEINELVFGKWLGKLITLSVAFCTLIFSSQVVFYVGEFMIVQIMPTTPIQAINILLVCVVLMGAKLGMVVLARTAEIFFPWIVLLFILFIVVIIPSVEPNQILPIGEISVMPVIGASLKVTTYSYISMFITFGVITHQVTSLQKAQKAYLIGVVVSGLILLSIVVASILVLGADNAATQVYPSYALAQRINVGNFLQRIEVIVAFLWLVSIYFKLSIFFYATIKGLAAVLQLRDYKILCVPIGIIITVLSLVVYPNKAYQQKWDDVTWIPLSLLLGLLYPFLILGVGWMRKMRAKKLNGSG
ncbi:endospore germination permease [Paenibacillus sp. GCM10027628]|uniref:GerAB/ArcD/ProY family transporter n=1 Tax=Paenibacillus sp. GCM10027628 TaxID=3273413 RepID=UPI0036394B51